MSTAKNLTKQAPTSPRTRIGGYPLLGRMADKGRAVIAGTAGEYHFDCPLDNMLFDFKGVKGSEVKPLLEAESPTWKSPSGWTPMASLKPTKKNRNGPMVWKLLAPTTIRRKRNGS